jgi:RNA recognition motif-containing protein
MRRVGKKSAVFDVPEEMRGQMEKLVNACKQEGSPIQDYEVLLVNSMEMLSDDEDDGNAEPDEDFDDKDVRTAMRNKREFEIFIGSLPTNADERELTDFFKQKKVKITNLRILRSKSVPI